MKKAALRLLPVAALAVFAVAGSALLPQSASSNSPIGNKILAHKLAVELGKEQRRGKEMPVSSGIDVHALRRGWDPPAAGCPQPGRDARTRRWCNHGISSPDTEGCQNVFHGRDGMTVPT